MRPLGALLTGLLAGSLLVSAQASPRRVTVVTTQSLVTYDLAGSGQVQPLSNIQDQSNAVGQFTLPEGVICDGSHDQLLILDFMEGRLYSSKADGPTPPLTPAVMNLQSLDIASDPEKHEFFVLSLGSVRTFRFEKGKPARLLRTLQVPKTVTAVEDVLAIDRAHGELLVGGSLNGRTRVSVYPLSGQGRTRPLRTFTLPVECTDFAVDGAHNELLLLGKHEVRSFTGASSHRLLRTLNLGMAIPRALVLDAKHDELLVAADGDIDTYPRVARGSARPERSLQPTIPSRSSLVGLDYDPVHDQIAALVVGVYTPTAVLTFNRTAQGNAPPQHTLGRLFASTSMGDNAGVFYGSNQTLTTFSSTASSWLTFAAHDTGEVKPQAQLQQSDREPGKLAHDRAHQEVFALPAINLGKPCVDVYSEAGRPLRQILLSDKVEVLDVAVHPVRDELLLLVQPADSQSFQVWSVARSASGETTPNRKLNLPVSGVNGSDLNFASDSIHDEIWLSVSQLAQPARLSAFSGLASGDAAPLRTIVGPKLLIHALAFDPSADELLVLAETGLHAYPRTATGEVSPSRSLQDLDNLTSRLVLGLTIWNEASAAASPTLKPAR